MVEKVNIVFPFMSKKGSGVTRNSEAERDVGVIDNHRDESRGRDHQLLKDATVGFIGVGVMKILRSEVDPFHKEGPKLQKLLAALDTNDSHG